MSIAFYTQADQPSHLIAVVGLGLIGQAVSDQFRLQAIKITQSNRCRMDWSDPHDLIANVKSAMRGNDADQLELIWCAGKAGFSSSQDKLDDENLFFKKTIVSLFEEFKNQFTVNLISSAGGLYEHSGRVSSLESLSPTRPYAHAKLAQEKLLNDLGVDHRIYRVSSAYGIGGNRRGLITVMLQSAINRQAMVIYANQNTLRDYILNTDIARTIVDDVLGGAASGARILASGRATSVDMLLNIVHRIIGARPVHSFQASDLNDRNIVFAPSIICNPSRVTSLEEGIRVVAKKLTMTDHLPGTG